MVQLVMNYQKGKLIQWLEIKQPSLYVNLIKAIKHFKMNSIIRKNIRKNERIQFTK